MVLRCGSAGVGPQPAGFDARRNVPVHFHPAGTLDAPRRPAESPAIAMSLWERFFPPRAVFRRDQTASQLAEAVKRQLLAGQPPEAVVAQLGQELAWSPDQAVPIVQWEASRLRDLPELPEAQRAALDAFLKTAAAAQTESGEDALKSAADIAWGRTGLDRS